MSAELVHQYRLMARYNCWLNERLDTACATLTDADRKRDCGAFFGSIHQTLTHLVLADKMWLQRFALQGVAFPALSPGLLHLPAGADCISATYPDWVDLIPFLNHPCTLSASLAARLCCRRFAFAFTNDVETESDTSGRFSTRQLTRGWRRWSRHFCLPR